MRIIYAILPLNDGKLLKTDGFLLEINGNKSKINFTKNLHFFVFPNLRYKKCVKNLKMEVDSGKISKE